MQRNPRSPFATSFEVASGHAWFANKTQEARLKPRLQWRPNKHVVQRNSRSPSEASSASPSGRACCAEQPEKSV
jgi:hypothetical protein